MLKRSILLFLMSNPRLSYVSDVEGCPLYWEKYLEFNDNVVKRDPTTGKLYMPEEETSFVFGGDCFDRGAGDISFARDLVQLKKDYPDRVTLLLGNRDICKMKLTSEVPPGDHEKPEDVPQPFFAGIYGTVPTYKDWIEEKGLKPSSISKLKWLLACTMSCPESFEFRRQELGGDGITDEQVYESFMGSLRPGGAVYEYIHHGQLAAIIDGTLFVHGGISVDNVGFVPDAAQLKEQLFEGTVPPGRSLVAEGRPAQDWVEALNEFAKTQVAAWDRQPTYDAKGNRGGSALLAYPHRTSLPTTYGVVCCRMARPALQYVDLKAVLYLNTSGVFRVLAGHMPTGDSPCVIQQPGLLSIIADTSYCDASGPNKNSRGKAIAEVLLYPDGRTRLRGRRKAGEPYDFYVNEEPLVGRCTQNGFWSKIVEKSDQEPEPKYLLHRTLDAYWSIEYKWMPHSEFEKELAEFSSSVGQGDTSGVTGSNPRPKSPTEVTKSPDGFKAKVKPANATA